MYRAKLITIALACGLLIGALIGGLLINVFPAHYPHWFEGIILFFLAIESVIVAFVEASSRKSTQKQLANAYLLTKVVKILLSLVFIGTYALVVKEGIKDFVLTFISFYLLFLVVETLIFVRIERRLKNKNNVE